MENNHADDINNIILLDPESPLRKNKIDRNSRELTIDSILERYIYNSQRYLSGFQSAIDKSYLSVDLLNFEKLSKLSGESFTLQNIMECFIENAIIRIQSIFDRHLLLVNAILDIGLSEDSISYNTIVGNYHVDFFGISDKIKKLNKIFREYRFIRNKVIHHGKFSEKEFDDLSLLLKADHLAKNNGEVGFIKEDEKIEMVNAYLLYIKLRLIKYLQDIKIITDDINTDLTNIYKYKKINFKQL